MMTTAEIQRAIAYHQQALQTMPTTIDSPKQWEHLGAIAALEAQLKEHLITEVEKSFCPSCLNLALAYNPPTPRP
jgi:hypothetical protein